MPGQKKMEDLVRLDSLEFELNRTPTTGPARARDQWKAAEEDWKRLWNGLLATIVGKNGVAVLEPRTLEELSEEPILSNGVVSKMPTVERALDRLLGCIKLERMMEERTFADYRAEVESRFRQVNDEAATWLPLADDLQLRLGAIIDKLETIPASERDPPEKSWNDNLAISLATIKGALSQSKEQLTILESCFSERAVEMAFVDSLRRTWNSVDRSFGTWIRRLLPAVWTMKYGVIVAVCAYLLIGMFLPTQLVLWIGVGIAFALAIRRYANTRNTLNDEIRQLHRRYAPALESGKETVWTPDLKKRFLEAVNPRREDEQDQEETKPTMPGYVLLAIAVCLTAYLLLTALASLDAGLTPRFRAFVNQTDSRHPCATATGTVQWAGPGLLVIAEHRDGGNELTVLAPESISGLTTNNQIKICAPNSNVTPEPTKILKPKPVGEVRFPRAIIIPFPGRVAGCGGEFNDDGAKLGESAMNTLQMVSSALKKCYPIRPSNLPPPSIDVMGFASDKVFACIPAMDSSQLNLKLAEHRRHEVLQELGAVFDKKTQQWKSDHFVIAPAGWSRWAEYKDMRKHIMYDHENDPIGRYAAVVVNHAGICTRS